MSSGSAVLVFFWVALRGAIILWLWLEFDLLLYFCCESSILAESGLRLVLDDGGVFVIGGEELSSSVLSS